MNLREVGRGIVWFGIGLAAAAVPIFLLQPCLHRDPVIRSYAVKPEIASEMRLALTEALTTASTDGMAIGRVSLTTDGRLLVAAPESVQKGVKSILAEVAAKNPAPTPSMRFEAWLVSAVPSTAPTADNVPGLAELGPALADIQKSRGPLRFELVEKLALQARAGDDDSELLGPHAGMRVVPTVRRDSRGEPVIAARIKLETMPRGTNQGALRALVELRPGQLLVIGQSGLPGQGSADAAPEAQVYYIVRASL